MLDGSDATYESGLGVHGQVVTYPPTPSTETISQGNHLHPVQQPQTSLWAEAPSQEGSPPLLIAQGPGVFGAAVPGPQPLPLASYPVPVPAYKHMYMSGGARECLYAFRGELHENEKNQDKADYLISQPLPGGLVPGGINYPLLGGKVPSSASPMPHLSSHLSPLLSSEGLTSGSGVTPHWLTGVALKEERV